MSTDVFNIGDGWTEVIKDSAENQELFDIYKSGLPQVGELFDEFVTKNNLPKVEVADFGGAIGDVTDYIKKNTKADAKINVTCFDVHKDLLDQNNSAGTKVQLDLLELSETERFDLGIMRFVLNYNSKEDQLKILGNIRNSLKPNSIFINYWCGVSGKAHQEKFQALFRNGKVNQKFHRPNSYWTTWEENKEIFEKAGFDVETKYEFTVPIRSLYKIRYRLTEEENQAVLDFLGEHAFISFVIFATYKKS